MDRSIAAFLQLPIFDEKFADGLERMGLARSEFWLTLDANESADEQIARFVGVIDVEQEIKDQVLTRIDCAPLLYDMIHRAREIATDLGFGALDHGCTVYPLTTEVFTRYCAWLENRSCRPAVIPALTYAARWVCKRLAMDPPDVKAPRVAALIEKVYTDRGKELKEAPPVPILAVSALEYYLNCLILDCKIPAAIFVWWTLILIYASLRWDDGKHVAA